MKSNYATITLFSHFLKDEAPLKPEVDDQTIWWEYLRSHKFANQTGLDLVALPYCRDFRYNGMVRDGHTSTTSTSDNSNGNTGHNGGSGNLLRHHREVEKTMSTRDSDITVAESKHFSYDLKKRVEASRAIMAGGSLVPYRPSTHFPSASSSISNSSGIDGDGGDKRVKGHTLVTCPLDSCVFSAGALRGVAYKMLEDGLGRR